MSVASGLQTASHFSIALATRLHYARTLRSAQHTEVHHECQGTRPCDRPKGHPDDTAREALAWIAETEALILQMKDAPRDPKLEWVARTVCFGRLSI